MTLLAMRTQCIAFDDLNHFVVSHPARKKITRRFMGFIQRKLWIWKTKHMKKSKYKVQVQEK